ncbi:MAG TPA: hypothetical protein DCM40_05615, partial [Maribacter sp.]|nr:hypothetical protein [Maribacter sp.]
DVTEEKAELLKEELRLQDSYLNQLSSAADAQERLLQKIQQRLEKSQDTEDLEKQITQSITDRGIGLDKISKLGKEYNLNLKSNSELAQMELSTLQDQEASIEDRL